MSKDLIKFIRNTLREAYSKQNILSEGGVANLSAKMSTQSIERANMAFLKITENINIANNYAWTPQGSANGELNTEEFNLLTELVREKTDIPTQKRIMMALYAQNNRALYNMCKIKVMRHGISPNDTTMVKAFMNGWEKIFVGGVETVDSKNRPNPEETEPTYYKSFDQYAAEYDPKKFTNFGAYISEAVQNATSESYDYEMRTATTSLDAPSRVTGKGRDVDSGEDYGSDALHAANPEDVLSGAVSDLDGGFEDGDTGETDLETDITSDEFDDVSGDTSLGDELSDELGDSDESEIAHTKAKKMAKILVSSIYDAIHDLKKQYSTPIGKNKITTGQLQALDNLEKTMDTGELVFDGFRSWGHSLDAIKKSAFITNQIDKYIKFGGFKNSRGKSVSFIDLQPKNLLDLINFSKTKDTSLAPEKEGLPSSFLGDKEAEERAKEIYGDMDLKTVMNKLVSIKKNAKKAMANPEKSEKDAEAVVALNDMLNGMDVRQVSQKLGKSAAEINNAIAGISQGEDAQGIVDLVRALKTGKYKKGYAVPHDEELQEAVKIANKMLFEKFQRDNIDKIMERVYRRLSNLL